MAKSKFDCSKLYVNIAEIGEMHNVVTENI